MSDFVDDLCCYLHHVDTKSCLLIEYPMMKHTIVLIGSLQMKNNRMSQVQNRFQHNHCPHWFPPNKEQSDEPSPKSFFNTKSIYLVKTIPFQL